LIESPSVAESPTVAEGMRVMHELLASGGPRPTGVFAQNDLLAVGAIQALRAAGLDCPRDVSIVGYNDAPLTAFTDPPLTTIALPGYELGRFAAEMALSLIDDPTRVANVLSLPPRLVQRGSTAPPHGD
jgi:LacI family transcriptional regulator